MNRNGRSMSQSVLIASRCNYASKMVISGVLSGMICCSNSHSHSTLSHAHSNRKMAIRWNHKFCFCNFIHDTIRWIHEKNLCKFAWKSLYQPTSIGFTPIVYPLVTPSDVRESHRGFTLLALVTPPISNKVGGPMEVGCYNLWSAACAGTEFLVLLELLLFGVELSDGGCCS